MVAVESTELSCENEVDFSASFKHFSRRKIYFMKENKQKGRLDSCVPKAFWASIAKPTVHAATSEHLEASLDPLVGTSSHGCTLYHSFPQ